MIDVLGVQLVERFDAALLAQVDARVGSQSSEPAHPACGPERAVRGMANPAEKRRVDQVGREAVLAQRRVLVLELLALGLVDCDSQAAVSSQSVTGELLEVIEGSLGQVPVLLGALRPQVAASSVVEHRPSSQREAAAAATGSRRDLSRLVQAHPQAPTRGDERRRAAGDTAADDRDVHRAVEPVLRAAAQRARRANKRSSRRC